MSCPLHLRMSLMEGLVLICGLADLQRSLVADPMVVVVCLLDTLVQWELDLVGHPQHFGCDLHSDDDHKDSLMGVVVGHSSVEVTALGVSDPSFALADSLL